MCEGQRPLWMSSFPISKLSLSLKASSECVLWVRDVCPLRQMQGTQGQEVGPHESPSHVQLMICFSAQTFPSPGELLAIPPNQAQLLSILTKDFSRPVLPSSVSAAQHPNSWPTASSLFLLCSQSPLPILAPPNTYHSTPLFWFAQICSLLCP